MIPENWDITTLDNLSSVITDGSHFSPKETLHGMKIIATVKNMTYNGFDFQSCKRISDEDYNALVQNGCSPQKGDILISKDGANCLDLIFVYNQDERIVILSSIAIVRLKPSYNPFFFRYYLLSPIAQKIMRDGYVSGSAIPRVILKDFKRIPVPKPPQKVQDSIATILCSFDSKIEINQQMNATLEKIGQAVFKHWFIDFQFSNEEGKPYKSSGGKMVDSDLGEIPKGWKIKEINNCGKVVCGKTPPTQNMENYGDDIPFITIPDMRGNVFVVKTEKQLSKLGAETQGKKELPPLAVCVSCIATPGLVSLTRIRSHTNQQINSIICNKDISPYFMFYSMKNKSEAVKTMGLGGTATLNLNTGNFSDRKSVV